MLRDFTFHKVVVPPSGVRYDWRWFSKSDVIVLTLDSAQVDRFARTEQSMLLDPQQFHDLP